MLMRAGTSRGPFFCLDDLPADTKLRDKIILDIMGSPHVLQVDGVGGGAVQTSKVAMVSKSTQPGADLDYLFAQVSVEQQIVDTSPNCGNMIVGVAPFAIERGLVAPQGDETTVSIYNVNTATRVEAVVQTPGGKVRYYGDFSIDGIAGSAAPIMLKFANAAGAKTGKLFPSGVSSERIGGILATLIDYSMPMLLIPAAELGLSGQETPQELDQSTEILQKIENMRQEAGQRMGLGDVADLVIPKVALLSKPCAGGALTSRYLTPHKCHKAHALTGAMGIIMACFSPDTVASQVCGARFTSSGTVSVEHPSGMVQFFVDLDDQGQIASMGVTRSARKIFAGEAFLKS